MTNQELDPSAEVVHLRRLLDVQPSCLMRLGADGVVLAANDAALMLLGIVSHAHALGKDFATWIPIDQRDRWKAFTFRVLQGSPASIECDITAPSGDRQATLFHGVPLTGHPDGLASIAVTARAVSGQRQLEATVVEREELLREFDAERTQARERLAEADAHRRSLEEKVRALEARLQQRLVDARPAPGADDVRQLRADLAARDEALAAAHEGRRAAEAKRDRALADCRQLEMALEAFAARHQKEAVRRQQREADLREIEVARVLALAGSRDERRA